MSLATQGCEAGSKQLLPIPIDDDHDDFNFF